jgi:translation elongation factor EF-Tu-like GTPase
MKNLTPSFIARLKYRTSEEGGRETPAKSGYRLQVAFDFTETQTSGQQIFLDKEIVYPGDTITAEITVLTLDIIKGKIKVGMTYEFHEDAKVIGTGEVLEILDKYLE